MSKTLAVSVITSSILPFFPLSMHSLKWLMRNSHTCERNLRRRSQHFILWCLATTWICRGEMRKEVISRGCRKGGGLELKRGPQKLWSCFADILILIILNTPHSNSKFVKRIKRINFCGSQFSDFSVCNFITTSLEAPVFNLSRATQRLSVGLNIRVLKMTTKMMVMTAVFSKI